MIFGVDIRIKIYYNICNIYNETKMKKRNIKNDARTSLPRGKF